MSSFHRKLTFSVLLFGIAILFLISGTNLILAQGGCDCTAHCEDPENVSPPPGCICVCPRSMTKKSFEDMAEEIFSWIMWAAIIIAPLMFIIAAFYLITSGGSPERARKAKQIFFYTLIGLFLALLAKGLATMVKNLLGVS